MCSERWCCCREHILKTKHTQVHSCLLALVKRIGMTSCTNWKPKFNKWKPDIIFAFVRRFWELSSSKEIDHSQVPSNQLHNCTIVIVVNRFLPTTPMLRGDQCWMLLRSQVSTASGSWMRQRQVSAQSCQMLMWKQEFYWQWYILHFSLQLHWHMESINRIFLLPRRKRGMLYLWIWAILDTKHQCVPLIRVNSRCEETTENMLNMCKKLVLFDLLLVLSSPLPDTVHCFWLRTRRERLWRGFGKAFLWGICQQVQAWCKVKAKSFGSAVPGVWKVEKAHERQLVRPATQHRVLHEWHWCLWEIEQVNQDLL